VQKEQKVKIAYSVGTMIEVPRGALTADEIAQTAEFFSFGTNDLTQTCLGMSAVTTSGNFLGAYTENEIFKKNPFATHRPDRRRPARADRASRRATQDPSGHQARHLRRTRRRPGFREVLPPRRPDLRRAARRYRVPVARLAAAQAAIEEKRAAKK
jgi:pyruvate,orthophosphate dikinase